MFEKKTALFYYTISPVHMGAGTALGLVDNPVQREVHTGHPVFAGSGLKGAFRHEAKADKDFPITEIFGPDSGSSDLYAGAVSFSDAQVVLFPVRSLKKGFVYVTSPLALNRAARLLEIAGDDKLSNIINGLGDVSDKAAMFDDSLKADKQDNKLVLEAFWFEQFKGNWTPFKEAVEYLSGLLPAKNAFFNEKVKTDTVLVSDDMFYHFVKNSVVVEPHVRIDDNTGTAEGGGLFYTESLPPETLMIGLMMASKSRQKGSNMEAEEIARIVTEKFNDQVLQIGGDTTTGRGMVIVKFVDNGQNQEVKNGSK